MVKGKKGGEKKMNEKEPYKVGKEEKEGLFVFACVVIVWIGIEITGVI